MSAPPLSPITLGTAQFGGAYGIVNDSGCPDDDEMRAILAAAEQAGIAYFDTAAAYGDAEERLGRLLADDRRPRWGKITKVPPLAAEADSAPALAAAVAGSVERSCKRLRTPVIDIVMFHRSEDMARHNGAALDALHAEVERGTVGAIGVSVYTPEDAVGCLGDRRIRHVQLPFNILDPRWTRPPFDRALAERPDVAVHARSAFLQGLLLSPPERWPDWVPDRRALAGAIDDCVCKLGCRDRIELCLCYNHSMSWIATSVVGVDSLAQFEMIARSFSGRRFDRKEMAMIAKLATLVPPRLLNPASW
jgi:aryl-alcohol dehydrogenase-like predicted oxidoreductase